MQHPPGEPRHGVAAEGSTVAEADEARRPIPSRIFLTPRNADAHDLPLQLESTDAQTLTELLQHTVGTPLAANGSPGSSDVQVRFQRGECSKFVGVEASATKELPSSTLRRSARFSESGGSQSLQVGTGTSKPQQSGAPPKLPCESSGSSMSIPEPACKGTLSDPQVISESELSPESKKSRKKTKGKKKTKSDQCRNRRWQDSWAASFPWAEKHREEG